MDHYCSIGNKCVSTPIKLPVKTRPYAGMDVSLESSSVCVADTTGRIVREGQISSKPEAMTAWLKGMGEGGRTIVRIGLEAGPLSQWLSAGTKQAGPAVALLETRHVRRRQDHAGEDQPQGCARPRWRWPASWR